MIIEGAHMCNPWDPRCDMNPEGHVFVAINQNGYSVVCSTYDEAIAYIEQFSDEGVIHRVKTEIVYFRKEAKEDE